MEKLITDSSVLDLSDFVYSIDKNVSVMRANDAFIAASGLKNESEIIGRKPKDLPWRSCHQVYETNNDLIMKERKPLCFIEPLPNVINSRCHILTVKAPLISDKNEVTGVQGISTPIEGAPFNTLMNKLMFASDKLNLLISPKLMVRLIAQLTQLQEMKEHWSKEDNLFTYGPVSFTLREAQCLHYFLKNYSSRETATKLFISHRTVEAHLANIKIKLDCNKKSQIVDKAFQYGFIDLIFSM